MKSSSNIFKILLSGLVTFSCICVQAQRNTLKDAGEQWQKAMDSKKADLITNFFDTDIVAIYHSNPAVYGKKANLKIWQQQFNDSSDRHPITIEKVDVSSSGDMGYIYGKWWSIHPVENYYNGGRYVSVWRLQNKEWRIVMLSVNVQDDVKAEKNKTKLTVRPGLLSCLSRRVSA